mgnify:CR=1 FL=1
MKRELTAEENNVLEDNVFVITCIYSNIELIRQGILGGDVVELSDINKALYLIGNDIENAIKNISNALGTDFLKLN